MKASHGGEAESGWPGLWRGGARWCWEPVGETMGWGDVTVTETEDALLAEPLPLAEGTRALEGHTEAVCSGGTRAGPPGLQPQRHHDRRSALSRGRCTQAVAHPTAAPWAEGDATPPRLLQLGPGPHVPTAAEGPPAQVSRGSEEGPGEA